MNSNPEVIKKVKFNRLNNTFLLKPDITTNCGDSMRVIIDVKYKNAGKNVSQVDIYQMLAYAVRYNCENIYLVYPKMMDSSIDGGILVDYKIKLEILNKDISIKIVFLICSTTGISRLRKFFEY